MHGHFQNGRVTSMVLLVFDRNHTDKPDDHANRLPEKNRPSRDQKIQSVIRRLIFTKGSSIVSRGNPWKTNFSN